MTRFSVFATVFCTSCFLSPGSKEAEGTLACGAEDVVDLWRVHSGAGTLVVTVDTVAAETAFDLGAHLLTVEEWSNEPEEVRFIDWLAEGDDEVPCTFPPPEYECPQFSGVAPADVVLMVETLGDCAGPEGEYVATATQDGSPVRLSFIGSADVDALRLPSSTDVVDDPDDMDGGEDTDEPMEER